MSYTLVEGGGSGGGGGDVATDISDADERRWCCRVGRRRRGYSLTDRKVVTVGTKPISLTPFYSHGALHVCGV